jgi:hypothetical protein
MSAAKAKLQIRRINNGLIDFAAARLRDVDFDAEPLDFSFSSSSTSQQIETGCEEPALSPPSDNDMNVE